MDSRHLFRRLVLPLGAVVLVLFLVGHWNVFERNISSRSGRLSGSISSLNLTSFFHVDHISHLLYDDDSDAATASATSAARDGTAADARRLLYLTGFPGSTETHDCTLTILVTVLELHLLDYKIPLLVQSARYPFKVVRVIIDRVSVISDKYPMEELELSLVSKLNELVALGIIDEFVWAPSDHNEILALYKKFFHTDVSEMVGVLDGHVRVPPRLTSPKGFVSYISDLNLCNTTYCVHVDVDMIIPSSSSYSWIEEGIRIFERPDLYPEVFVVAPPLGLPSVRRSTETVKDAVRSLCRSMLHLRGHVATSSLLLSMDDVPHEMYSEFSRHIHTNASSLPNRIGDRLSKFESLWGWCMDTSMWLSSHGLNLHSMVPEVEEAQLMEELAKKTEEANTRLLDDPSVLPDSPYLPFSYADFSSRFSTRIYMLRKDRFDRDIIPLRFTKGKHFERMVVSRMHQHVVTVSMATTNVSETSLRITTLQGVFLRSPQVCALHPRAALNSASVDKEVQVSMRMPEVLDRVLHRISVPTLLGQPEMDADNFEWMSQLKFPPIRLTAYAPCSSVLPAISIPTLLEYSNTQFTESTLIYDCPDPTVPARKIMQPRLHRWQTEGAFPIVADTQQHIRTASETRIATELASVFFHKPSVQNWLVRKHEWMSTAYRLHWACGVENPELIHFRSDGAAVPSSSSRSSSTSGDGARGAADSSYDELSPTSDALFCALFNSDLGFVNATFSSSKPDSIVGQNFTTYVSWFHFASRVLWNDKSLLGIIPPTSEHHGGSGWTKKATTSELEDETIKLQKFNGFRTEIFMLIHRDRWIEMIMRGREQELPFARLMSFEQVLTQYMKKSGLSFARLDVQSPTMSFSMDPFS